MIGSSESVLLHSQAKLNETAKRLNGERNGIDRSFIYED